MLTLIEHQPFKTRKEVLKGLCDTYDIKIYIKGKDDIYYKYKLDNNKFYQVDQKSLDELKACKNGYNFYTSCKLTTKHVAIFIYNTEKVFDLQTLRMLESIFWGLSRDFIIYENKKCIRRVTLYPDKLYNLEDYRDWAEKVLGQEVKKIIFLNGDVKVR